MQNAAIGEFPVEPYLGARVSIARIHLLQRRDDRARVLAVDGEPELVAVGGEELDRCVRGTAAYHRS